MLQRSSLIQLKNKASVFIIVFIIVLFNFVVFPLPVFADKNLDDKDADDFSGKTVRIGLYENSPKIFTDSKGNASGFWPDIIRNIAEKQGWNIKWVPGTWRQGLERLEGNKIDIMPDTAWTEPRSKRFAFNKQTVLMSWSLLYTRKESGIESILDLKGKTIGALEESVNLNGPEGIKELVQSFEIKCNFIEMDSYEDVFKALEQGQLDAAVTNKDFGKSHQNKYNIERTPVIFQPARIQFAFTKASSLTPYLIKTIDTNIKKLKNNNNSIYYKSLDRWLAGYPSKTVFPEWAKNLGIIIIACLIILVFGNIILRSKVRSKTRSLKLEIETCKKAEKQEKKIEKALVESEKEYRSIFENAIEGIFQSTPEGRFIKVNPAFAKMLGYESCEELVDSIDDIENQYYFNPEDRPILQDLLKRQGKVKNFECKVQKKDGSQIWVTHSTHAVYNVNNNIIIYEGFVSNIDERKKLEAQLIHSQKIESIGTLAGGIAHDFNNILTAILGYADIALMDIEKSSPVHKDLTEIKKAGARATDLVKQILTISRHDDREIQPVNITYLIKEALNMLRSTIPASIEIKENISRERMVVQADYTQLHQVIVNLATNAKLAMENETGIVEVCAGTVKFDSDLKAPYPDMKHGDYARIKVKDTGKGIPEKNMEKIFDPYFTTREKTEGAGLGLSVVQGIIKKHKGSIGVESEPGKGTTFYIYLPLMKETFEEKPSPVQENLPTGTENILLVDDEPAIIEIEQTSLERLGYKVTAFTSSIKAFEAFKNNPEIFDLVITDMTMPDMTGDLLARELKNIRNDIPVILCTGYSEKINGDEQDPNFDCFLMKPVSPARMAETVREVLDKKRVKK